MPVRSADLPTRHDDYLQEYCRKKDKSQSEALREFVEQGIKTHDKRHQWAQSCRMGSHMMWLVTLIVMAVVMYLPGMDQANGVILMMTIFLFGVILSVTASYLEPEGI